MKLYNSRPAKGGEVEARKRVGRGHGSGLGHNAGRGRDGQNSRSGGGVRPGFEGDQMPLLRELLKRGFKSHSAKQYAEINIRDLNYFEDGEEITPETPANAGFFKPAKAKDGVKTLGDGEITKKLTTKANKFTKSAEEKITEAGGKIGVI